MIRLFSIFPFVVLFQGYFLLPVNSGNRIDVSKIQLTKIGQFGILRKARPNIPEHYHTGIDIMRPTGNYISEPIFPIVKGQVISKRTDGPYANLIIEHKINGAKFWSLYEHIAGIKVGVGDIVDHQSPIARFMNKAELNRFGWQFDHFHLEVIKTKPERIKPDTKNPERFFISYSLICYNIYDLNKYFYNPIDFLKNNCNNK